MDAPAAPPAGPPAADSPAPDAPPTGRPVDRLGAEVRESALLLLLSFAVTAGLSAGAQALLAFAS